MRFPVSLADESGLISTKTGKVTPEVLASIHFKGTLRDIVEIKSAALLCKHRVKEYLQ